MASKFYPALCVPNEIKYIKSLVMRYWYCLLNYGGVKIYHSRTSKKSAPLRLQTNPRGKTMAVKRKINMMLIWQFFNFLLFLRSRFRNFPPFRFASYLLFRENMFSQQTAYAQKNSRLSNKDIRRNKENCFAFFLMKCFNIKCFSKICSETKTLERNVCVLFNNFCGYFCYDSFEWSMKWKS